MSEQHSNQNTDDEISFKDIIDFLRGSWRIILISGVLGLAVTGTYIVITPNRYEATTLIQMAQIDANGRLNPLGVNVEEPGLLIARMNIPTSYDTKTSEACGSERKLGLTGSTVRLAQVKGVASLIELKINSSSKESATHCSQAVFELIQKSQYLISQTYINEAKTKLAEYNNRLQDLRSLVVESDKASAAMITAYLSAREEIKFFSDEIIRLNNFIVASNARHAKLISPVHVSDHPVSPRKTIILMAGILGGISLGFLLAILRKVITGYRQGA